jgi:hypothetical protein
VLVDDSIARLAAGPRVDPERGDAEVVPDRAPRLSAVRNLVDLVEVCDLVLSH